LLINPGPEKRHRNDKEAVENKEGGPRLKKRRDAGEKKV